MHVTSPPSVWVQPDDTIFEDTAGDESDAQDASYAFDQLNFIKPRPMKPNYQAFPKPGAEATAHGAKLDHSQGAQNGYSKDGFIQDKYTKDGYGDMQDKRYRTQTDSYEEDSGRLSVMKDRDPVSVLPSHLYSTDDEHSTQHVISASNSAQAQPNTAALVSSKAASLHLPSISDIYAAVGADATTGGDGQSAQQKGPAQTGGGSIHYQEYEPSSLPPTSKVSQNHQGLQFAGNRPGNSTSPTGLFGQQNAGVGQQDVYMADAGFLQQVNDGLAHGRAGKWL